MPDPKPTIRELFVAAHGSGSEHGLHRFGLKKGAWRGTQLATVPALSALAAHPWLPVVYGTSGTHASGNVHAWRITADCASPIGEARSGGTEPCHLAVDANGRWLVVVNYASGSLAVWGLADNGSLTARKQLLELTGAGADLDRQDAAHPHQVVLDRELAYVPDLGADLIRIYAVGHEPPGALSRAGQVPVPPGTGPRHMVVLRDGAVAVSGELRSTILTADRLVGAATAWSEEASTRCTSSPSTGERNYPGDIAASSDGRLAYLANRGHDTVSTFLVGNGTAHFLGEVDAGVRWPQHLLVGGDALLVAGRESSQVVALALVDGVPTSSRTLFECPGAAWLLPAFPSRL
jgi:6-phosphogluconolactonase